MRNSILVRFLIWFAHLCTMHCGPFNLNVKTTSNTLMATEDGILNIDEIHLSIINSDCNSIILGNVDALNLRGIIFNELKIKTVSELLARQNVTRLSLMGCNLNERLIEKLNLGESLKQLRIENVVISPTGIRALIDKLPDNFDFGNPEIRR